MFREQKLFAFKLLVVLLFALNWHTISIAQNLKLNTYLDKSEYLYGEDIYILFVLKNEQPNPILVRRFDPITGNLKLVIRDKMGNIQRLKVWISEGPQDYGTYVSPSDSISYATGLSFWGNDDTPDPSFRKFNVGEYTVTSTYTNTIQSIASEEIKFRVLAPTGENKSIFDQFLNAQKCYKSPDHIYISALEVFNNTYPNNIYESSALRALFLAHAVRKEGNRELSKKYKGIIITKYCHTICGLTNYTGLWPEQYEELVQKKYVPENLDKDTTNLIGKYREVARYYLNEKRYKKVKIDQQD
jgi:hypothetical protein